MVALFAGAVAAAGEAFAGALAAATGVTNPAPGSCLRGGFVLSAPLNGPKIRFCSAIFSCALRAKSGRDDVIFASVAQLVIHGLLLTCAKEVMIEAAEINILVVIFISQDWKIGVHKRWQ